MIMSMKTCDNSVLTSSELISSLRVNSLLVNSLLILLIGSFLLAASFTSYGQEGEVLRIMSFNIRLDTPDDSVNQWKHRKADLCAEVQRHDPHVMGVQEAMNNQMVDLRKCLTGYRSIGVARDDGKKQGEFSALFYKKKVLKPIRSGTFWLSETPDVAGSRGWDAACNRVVTWAEFKDKRTRKHFMAFNTHFDHMGDTARVESALLIIRKVAELTGYKSVAREMPVVGEKPVVGDVPVILTGDFNVTEKHRAYRILTYPENEVVLTDSRLRAKDKTGPDHTWVTFNPDFEASDVIDFIFISLDVEVLKHTIIDFRKTGRHLSDHLPVVTEVVLK